MPDTERSPFQYIPKGMTKEQLDEAERKMNETSSSASLNVPDPLPVVVEVGFLDVCGDLLSGLFD